MIINGDGKETIAIRGIYKVVRETFNEDTVYIVYQGTRPWLRYATKGEAMEKFRKMDIVGTEKIDRRGAIEATKRKIAMRGISA